MTLYHAKTNTVSDQTGTVTVGAFPNTSTVAATDEVRPTDWNSAHVFGNTIAGNTAGTNLVTGTNLVFAGGNNLTISASQGTDGGATLSFSAGADTIDQISISAGTQTTVLGSLVFSDSNGVSFGLNGSTLTGSIATSLSNIKVSAGTVTNLLSAITFADGNGVSFGLNASTLTASIAAAAGNTISYWDNYNVMTGAVTRAFSNSSSFIFPIVMPQAISIGFLRFPVSGVFPTGNAASTATGTNTSLSQSFLATYAYGFYQQNTGASSASLTLLASSALFSTLYWQVTANSNGSEYTVSAGVSYPVRNTTSSFSTSYASTRTRFDLLSSALSNFGANAGNDLLALDLVFGSSLPASNLWFAFGQSTNSAGNFGTNVANVLNPYLLSGTNAGLSIMGEASNSSNCPRVGQGVFSSTVSGFPAGLALANISTQVSGLGAALLQMIRRA